MRPLTAVRSGAAGAGSAGAAGAGSTGAGWASCAKRRPAARVRLYCFPYAGGGAAAYHPWAGRLPSDVELWSICLPGREQRLFEPAYTDLDALVGELRTALAGPLADSPVPAVFFGHSMGALLAFELARALRDRGDPEPAGLVLSARAGAHHAPRRRLHALPEEEFVAAIRGFGAAPAEALSNPELRELCLPTLRADFTLAETYRYRPGRPLDCPLTTWAATDDHGATPDLVADWGEHTRGEVHHHTFEGGHFFLREASVLDVLAQDLDRMLP
jgi:medium-chain acyl-[acyl-carrier-protein] hydrolase